MNTDHLMNALLLAALKASTTNRSHFVRADGRVAESAQVGGVAARDAGLRVTPRADVVDAVQRRLGNVLAMCTPGSVFGAGGGR